MDYSTQHSSEHKTGGWARHAPLAIILTVAVIGYFTLRDYITFDTLRDNREALLAFRDANFGLMVLAFIGIYFVIVAFSLPGAAVAIVARRWTPAAARWRGPFRRRLRAQAVASGARYPGA